MIDEELRARIRRLFFAEHQSSVRALS